MKKKVSFIDKKPKQMINIDVKVKVKVTNGTISKKGEKPVILSFFGTKVCNVSRIYLWSFDIFTKIIIATI